MTQIYTILFDLDGTIVNTAPDLMAAHNHVMRKYGHDRKKLRISNHWQGEVLG